MSFKSFVLNLLVFIFLFSASSFAHAQNAGVGLKPITIDDRLLPGETKTHVLTVSNLSDDERTYYVFSRDIVSATETGAPIFADGSAEITGYELSQWITLSTDVVTLAPRAETSFEVTIAVPDEVAPGSHFAGVFVSNEPPRAEQTGAAVGYQVANIISIRIPGDVFEKAFIRQFSTDNYIYSTRNVAFNVRVENTGSTLIRPIGPISITDMFGREVWKSTFNDNLGGVFPGRTREFTFDWSDDVPGFGRYEAIVSPVYGDEGSRQTMSSTVVFWILPMNIILPALGILAFVLLLTYLFARLYVRRQLARYGAMSGGRRLVRRQKQSSSAFLLITISMLVVTGLFLIVLLVLFA
jgi:hypothetical protein